MSAFALMRCGFFTTWFLEILTQKSNANTRLNEVAYSADRTLDFCRDNKRELLYFLLPTTIYKNYMIEFENLC